jgi:two-component system sensor histidine kinase BaeS
MIRLTIQRKVFLATFALAAAMALLLSGLTRWNLEQGFTRYVVETEIGRLDWLVTNLETAYAKGGSWDFLKDSVEPWDRAAEQLVREGRPPDFQGPPGFGDRPPFGLDDRPPPPFADGRPPHPGPPGLADGRPPPDTLAFRPRLSLRDRSGAVLAGHPAADGPWATRPIRFKGETVGLLALRAPPVGAALDLAFLATQAREIWLSALAALVLSLVAAWLLARQLLRPIRDLTAGARQITEGRFSERIPVRGNDELAELAEDFNAMARMLAQNDESRRQWISDSSHELRTPIAVLRAEIEALQDAVRTADEPTLARLHRNVMQMSKLVDDLRQTLDRDDGEADLELSPLDPLAVIRETAEEFAERFGAAGLTLDASRIPPGRSPWRIRGDRDRLHQVFANLLENTLRYTDPGGRLEITASSKSGRLRLQFDDSAPAPPEAAMKRLFERFFRAEPSRSRQHGGSGLGLAICRRIILGHGGTIVAARSDLGGLSIRIDLPLES